MGWTGRGRCRPSMLYQLSYGVATAGTRTRVRRIFNNPITSARADFADVQRTGGGIGRCGLRCKGGVEPQNPLTDSLRPAGRRRTSLDIKETKNRGSLWHRTATVSSTLTFANRPSEDAGCMAARLRTQALRSAFDDFTAMLWHARHKMKASVGRRPVAHGSRSRAGLRWQ